MPHPPWRQVIRDKARVNAVAKAAARRSQREAALTPNPLTAEREYSGDEMEFLRAVESYRKRTGKRFLTACEYLAVAREELGYAKP